MAEITIKVSDALAEKLESMRARLPEVLAQGLQELSPLPNHVYRYVIDFLVSNPSQEAIAQFHPTPEMQERAQALLEENRASQLTPRETAELDEYVRIDYLITMLKAHAFPSLHAIS